MRIDETQRGWLIASLAILALALLVYVPYALSSPQGPRGSSAIGLAFGIVGSVFMLFAAALGARKRVPTWRIGRAQAWMRGHLWLGLLSLPLILFHGGFHFGGTLTRVLLWLFIAVVASGVIGAVLQHYLPRRMTAGVPLETIYDEISNVRTQLRDEADRYVEAICGPLEIANASQNQQALYAGGSSAVRAIPAPAAAAAPALAAVALTEGESLPLRRFYLEEMRPFLENSRPRHRWLADETKTRNTFAGLKTILPPAAHATLDDLADICDEARQLRRQARLHHWLHGWLLVHIPLSLALIFLGAVHAVMALRYSS